MMKLQPVVVSLFLLPLTAAVRELGTVYEDKFDSEKTDFVYKPDILDLEGQSSWSCSTDDSLMWGGHHKTTYGKGLHTEFVDETSGGLKLGLLGGLESGGEGGQGSCGNVGFALDFKLDRRIDHARIRLQYRPKVSKGLQSDPTPGGEMDDSCEIRMIVNGKSKHKVVFHGGEDEVWKSMYVNPGELHSGHHQLQIVAMCVTPWSQFEPFEVRFDNFEIVEVISDDRDAPLAAFPHP